MRAKLIYEVFSEEGDPIKDMGIGEIHQIQKDIPELNLTGKNPDELLIIGIKTRIQNKEAQAKLINYAIKSGAKVLWYKYDGAGLPQILNDIVEIKKADVKDFKPQNRWYARQYFQTNTGTIRKQLKITFSYVYSKWPHASKNGSSVAFNINYSLLSNEFMQEISNNFAAIKNVINNFKNK